jgi:purine-binding chemotaxis protein CheW
MIESKSASQSTESRDRGAQLGSAAPDSVVCFALAGKSYALDVTVVREVVSIDKLLPVPRTKSAISGVFALHGATIALVDTRILFGLPPATAANTTLIVARSHRTICGLTIDRVLGVARFAEASFTPAVRGRDPAQIAGFLPDDQGGLITVLDTAALLQALEGLRC